MTQLFKNVCLSNMITQFRFIREIPWKQKYTRRFGYSSPFFNRPDTLPRIKEDHKHAKVGMKWMSDRKLINQWSDKRKYFGQNDYIDILGDGSIHPTKLLTHMPPWLRGFRGNEFQMLLLKQRAYQHYRWTNPTRWKNLNRRVMFLYRYLNRKTKT